MQQGEAEERGVEGGGEEGGGVEAAADVGAGGTRVAVQADILSSIGSSCIDNRKRTAFFNSINLDKKAKKKANNSSL